MAPPPALGALRRCAFLALVVAAALSPPHRVSAQAPASDAAGVDPEYLRLVRAALEEFDGHRFEESRALFRQAHERSPNARTLRGIGLASFEMRDYVAAYHALTLALADRRSPLTDELRVATVALIERTASFVGRFRLSVRPADAELSVDGAAVSVDPDGWLVLGLGGHVIRVTAEGHRGRIETVSVEGGEEDALSFDLTPLAEPAPRGDRVGRPRPADLSPEPAGPIGLLVAGGAAAAASVVVGLTWWLSAQEEVNVCAEGRPGFSCANPGELSSLRDAAAATTVTVAGVGAALLIGGGAWLASAIGVEDQALGCVPTVLGLSCRMAF